MATETIFTIMLIGGWFILAAFLAWWLLKRKGIILFKKGKITKTTSSSTKSVLLAIEVPKENDKTPLAAETLFSSLHGIGMSHLSFEIEAREKSIRFYTWVPGHLRGYVEGQLYAQYSDINIMEVKDYSRPSKIDNKLAVVETELAFSKKDFYPINTFENFTVDPLAAITGVLSKLQLDEHVWIQVLIKPESDDWRTKAINFISAVKEGRDVNESFGKTIVKGLAGLAGDVVKTAMSGSSEEGISSKGEKTELSPGVSQVLQAIEDKSSKLGFRTKIRLVALDKDEITAKNRLQLVLGAFKQFNTNNLNAFEAGKQSNNKQDILAQYHDRDFGVDGLVLNVTELASIYHLPNISVTTPNILWAGSKKGEPPSNLPLMDEVPAEELTVIAKTNFRGSDEKFGIKLKDRHRHIYVMGKSGTGKSTLLENMAVDDIRERRGLAVIDPHGDFVGALLNFVPSYRVNDVIVFDPGDRDYPIAINMFEITDPKYKVVVASGIVGIFKKIFGYSWGPRLEYWLSSAVLALLDYPDATLLMVPRLFTDKEFRKKVIDKVQDPLIKSRWINEYGKLDQRQQSETISPILNKVGQFLSSPLIRNVVGQPKSSIDFRSVMDEGKILLVRLSKGIIGEDNAALLGSMIITQIQLAAMTRADVSESERKDFYLYVDEFQNFATESFQTILSEARKYHLSLTLANQYMEQLSEEVRSSIFGNVNTLITFRVGGADAESLVKEFTPVFDANDLVNLSPFNIYIKLSIDNLTTDAFSAQTLPLPADKNNLTEKIINVSRERYARDIKLVQEKINESLAAEQTEGFKKETPRYYNKAVNYPQREKRYAKPASRPSIQPTEKKVEDKPIQPSKKTDSSLLKKVISAIETKKPWAPSSKDEKKANKSNLISGLKQNKDTVEELRKQRSDESQMKENEWVPLDDVNKEEKN